MLNLLLLKKKKQFWKSGLRKLLQNRRKLSLNLKKGYKGNILFSLGKLTHGTGESFYILLRPRTNVKGLG